MKRVVVTGATGFVGRELVPELLARGHEVHLLGRSKMAISGCPAHRCDLLAEDAGTILTGIQADSLVHLAWYAKAGAFWDAPENLDWTAASLRLVRAFADAGGKRAVIAGTCAEYDWDFLTLDEARTPLRPHTLYGLAKASLFRLLTASAPKFGLSLAWPRLFFPYGAREQPGRLLGSLIDNAVTGAPISVSPGLQSRDFIHVRDVATAIATLLDSDLEGAINIASGDAVRVRDFVELAAHFAGAGSRVDFGALPMRAGDPFYMAASVTRLREELGFVPAFDLRSGLAEAVRGRMALVTGAELG